jgi:methylisocitrate lyase
MADDLRSLLGEGSGLFAPLVMNPLMAQLAAATGFQAGYVGGGALGFQRGVTEAHLGLTDMAQLGLAIRAASSLPLILDAACGWGDPMHVAYTIATAEAAGFSAIEIEDQVLPKRAHHHIGVEHLVPRTLMREKIRAAVSARREPGFLVIGRTNAARVANLDEALRRAEDMHAAGADLLLVMPRAPEELARIAERLPKPLMYIVPTAGLGAIGISVQDLWALGYRLVVDPGTPLFAMHRALRAAYAAMAEGRPDPLLGADGPVEERHIHGLVGLEAMLDIERATVEPGAVKGD